MEVLTAHEAAEFLRCTPQTIWAKVREDKIPYFRIGENGAIRFDKDVLIEWARKQMQVKEQKK